MKRTVTKLGLAATCLFVAATLTQQAYAYGPGDEIPVGPGIEATSGVSGEVSENVSMPEQNQPVNTGVATTHYNFYYEQLSENEKNYYTTILNAIKSGATECDVGYDVPTETLYKVLIALYNDNPEVVVPGSYQLYRSGYTGGPMMTTYYTGVTQDKVTEFNLCNTLANEMLADIYSTLGGDFSQQNIVKHIYDYLVLNVDYDGTVANNQDVRSVFFTHRSVCTGYSKTFQYLCNLAGIDCTIVNGFADGGRGIETHEWNLVRYADGTYAYYDVTFGDVYENRAVSYDYYGSPTLFATHKVQDNLIGEGGFQLGAPLLFQYPNV